MHAGKPILKLPLGSVSYVRIASILIFGRRGMRVREMNASGSG
jgi:hypothetical protein